MLPLCSVNVQQCSHPWSESPKRLVRWQIAGPSVSISDSIQLVWVPLICLPNMFPSSANSAYQEVMFLRVVVLLYVSVAQLVKNPPTGDTGDGGSIPGLGRSPGVGYSNHSSILAWKIPWTGVPGGLLSVGLQRVRYDWGCMHGENVSFF